MTRTTVSLETEVLKKLYEIQGLLQMQYRRKYSLSETIEWLCKSTAIVLNRAQIEAAQNIINQQDHH